jgi:outer membrane protein assembly factor BamB
LRHNKRWVMRRFLISIITACILAPAPSFGQGMHPWPMYGGGPKRDGQSFVGRKTGGGAVGRSYVGWKLYVGQGAGNNSVVTAGDGTIYALGDDGASEYLYAVSSEGKELWKIKLGILGRKQSTSPLIGEDGTVYTTGSDGYFYAATPQGQLKWKAPTGGAYMWDFNYPVMSKDGVIYVASRRGTEGAAAPGLRAVSMDGRILWHYPEPAMGTSVSDDGTVFSVIGDSGNLRLASFTNKGDKKWEAQLTGHKGNGPVIYKDGTLLVTGDGHLSAYTQGGELKWKAVFGETNFYESKPFIGLDGLIYVLGRGNLYVINIKGDILLKSPQDCFNGTGLVDKGGNIYFGAGDTQEIVSVSPYSKGRVSPLFKLSISADYGGTIQLYPSAPAIGVDGTIYHVTEEGYLYAIEPK